MLRHLRSLQPLLAFEAAGRHRSFKKAAEEMYLTPSAISRQIGALEEDLGVRLFRRLPRGLELSEAGATYLAEVRQALERLERASDAARGRRAARPLRISVLQAFAGNWLVPRLPRFEAAHPEIDVRLEATTAYADFRHDDVDLAIRYGRPPWPGLHAETLVELQVFPVCRPRGPGEAPLRRPQDLAQQTWLESVQVPDAWRVWLEAAGAAHLRPRRRLYYDNAQLVLDAAMAGQGVALVTDLLAERYLREGRLIRPFRTAVASPRTYYLVARAEDLERPQIRAFREWILDEMDAWRTASAARPRVRRTQPRVRKNRLSRAQRAR
jgi:LysR family glycine cleavage system transcriptional activator